MARIERFEDIDSWKKGRELRKAIDASAALDESCICQQELDSRYLHGASLRGAKFRPSFEP